MLSKEFILPADSISNFHSELQQKQSELAIHVNMQNMQ